MIELFWSDNFNENWIYLSVIIPHIDLSAYAPKRIKFTKIDVSNWNEVQIKETIVDLINQYANKLGKQYDFNTQKNTEPLELIWKDFQTCLLQYTDTKIKRLGKII